MTDKPNVIVVGQQQLADFLAKANPNWNVQPAANDVNMMWDLYETGELDNDSSIAVFTDGTGTQPDELEESLIAFAPYCEVFLVIAPARINQVLTRIRGIEEEKGVAEGDGANIHIMPQSNIHEAMSVLRKNTQHIVAWPTPSPTQQKKQPSAKPQPAQTQRAGQAEQRTPEPPQVKVQVHTPTVEEVEEEIEEEEYQPLPTPKQTTTYEQNPVYPPTTAQQAIQEHDKLENARPGQVTIAVMSSKGGSGKCLRVITKLQNPVTGELSVIKDIVNDTTTTHALGFDGRFISSQKINDKIYSGVKETFTVKMKSGRNISATSNHPLLTTDGWRELSSIQVGETLAVPSKVPFPSQPTYMNEAELDMLAVIMAEGGTSQKRTNFTTNDPEIAHVMYSACNNLGLRVARYNHPMQYIILKTVLPSGSINSCSCGCVENHEGTRNVLVLEEEPSPDRIDTDWLRRFRREHGLEGTLAKNKTMPQAVFRLSEEQLSRFLSLFWMCDGYASASGGGDVGVTLASKSLIEALQHLLLRFGIMTTLRYKKATAGGKTFDAWRLTVQAPSYPVFQQAIPLWGYKAENLQILIDRAENGGSNPNLGCPTFSDELYTKIVTAGQTTDKHLAEKVCKRLGWNVETFRSPSMVLTHKKTVGSGRKHLNLKGLRLWCEMAGLDVEREFGWIYDSELFWDEVVSVTSDGLNEVYDLEIPSVHNFVANDVVVHNSTSAICLAGTIARASAAAGQPKSVVLVDLDTRDGQVGSLIGQYVPTSINIRVMPRWDAPTVKENLVHDKRLGIDALLAPVRPRNADDVGADFYRKVIEVLQTTHDVVILDCSVNYLDPLLGTAFALSDEILFVTTLAATSVQGMARSLTELFAPVEEGGLGIPRVKVGVVANQVINNVGMGKDKLLRAALGAPLVGQIPAEQDAVLIATNNNKMGDLLKHPRLGPAYFKLASVCLPGLALVDPETRGNGQHANSNEGRGKGGFFRR